MKKLAIVGVLLVALFLFAMALIDLFDKPELSLICIALSMILLEVNKEK